MLELLRSILPWVAAGGFIWFLFRRQEIKDLKIQEKDHYVIRYDGWIFVIMLIDFVLFGFILIVSQTSDQSDIITTIVFGLFTLVGLYGMLSVALYRVEVKGEDIKYRSPVGTTKCYTFSMISKGVRKKGGSFYVYNKKDKLFGFSDNMSFEHFVNKLVKKGIPIESK